ncbi:unnamed protein product, partial [Discosporangium mesarthrocarpum]
AERAKSTELQAQVMSLTGLREELQISKERLSSAGPELAAARENARVAREGAAAMAGEVASLQAELDAVREELQACQLQNEDLRAAAEENEGTSAQLEEALAEAAELRRQLQEVQERSSISIARAVAAAAEEKSSLESEIVESREARTQVAALEALLKDQGRLLAEREEKLAEERSK